MHDIILNMQEGVFKYTLKDCQFVLSDSPVWMLNSPVVLGLSGKMTYWEHRTLWTKIRLSDMEFVLSGNSLSVIYNSSDTPVHVAEPSVNYKGLASSDGQKWDMPFGAKVMFSW
jgi:hypothetical protein